MEALSLNHVPPGNSPQVVLNISETWPDREIKALGLNSDWCGHKHWFQHRLFNLGHTLDPFWTSIFSSRKWTEEDTVCVAKKIQRVDPHGAAWGTAPNVHSLRAQGSHPLPPCCPDMRPWCLSQPDGPWTNTVPEAAYTPNPCPACPVDPAHGIFALSKRKPVNPQEV